MYSICNVLNNTIALVNSLSELCLYVQRINEINAFIPEYNIIKYNDIVLNSKLIYNIVVKYY